MKAIVTIVGKDQVGIIANVCSQLAACNINILEISQKIMDGFFTMMLVTDLSGCKQPLDEVSELLKTCAEGRAIIEMGSRDLGTGCTTAYEKDGDIYVVYAYITDGFLGSPCHFYVMKYDFDSHTLEYYTSVFFEEYPEPVYDLYIP